jgi:hypothetical protein
VISFGVLADAFALAFTGWSIQELGCAVHRFENSKQKLVVSALSAKKLKGKRWTRVSAGWRRTLPRFKKWSGLSLG